MKALLYKAINCKKANMLKSVLMEVLGEDRLEVFFHFHDLERYFRTPRRPDDLTIGVFAAADRENLRQLASIRDIIADMSIILVLPDRNHKTIAEGHKLQPRFVAYIDSNFKEIGAVVRKMMKAANPTAAVSNTNRNSYKEN